MADSSTAWFDEPAEQDPDTDDLRLSEEERDDLLTEMDRAFHTPAEAIQLLRRIGYPLASMPAFRERRTDWQAESDRDVVRFEEELRAFGGELGAAAPEGPGPPDFA